MRPQRGRSGWTPVTVSFVLFFNVLISAAYIGFPQTLSEQKWIFWKLLCMRTMYAKYLIQCLARGTLGVVDSFIYSRFIRSAIYLFIYQNKHLLKSSFMPGALVVARDEVDNGLAPTGLPFSLGEIDNKKRNKNLLSYRCCKSWWWDRE